MSTVASRAMARESESKTLIVAEYMRLHQHERMWSVMDRLRGAGYTAEEIAQGYRAWVNQQPQHESIDTH